MESRRNILMAAKETSETSDIQKVAQLLQTREWVAIDAVERCGEIFIVLIRV
jgi:hypothetical protein